MKLEVFVTNINTVCDHLASFKKFGTNFKLRIINALISQWQDAHRVCVEGELKFENYLGYFVFKSHQISM